MGPASYALMGLAFASCFLIPTLGYSLQDGTGVPKAHYFSEDDFETLGISHTSSDQEILGAFEREMRAISQLPNSNSEQKELRDKASKSVRHAFIRIDEGRPRIKEKGLAILQAVAGEPSPKYLEALSNHIIQNSSPTSSNHRVVLEAFSLNPGPHVLRRTKRATQKAFLERIEATLLDDTTATLRDLALLHDYLIEADVNYFLPSLHRRATGLDETLQLRNNAFKTYSQISVRFDKLNEQAEHLGREAKRIFGLPLVDDTQLTVQHGDPITGKRGEERGLLYYLKHKGERLRGVLLQNRGAAAIMYGLLGTGLSLDTKNVLRDFRNTPFLQSIVRQAFEHTGSGWGTLDPNQLHTVTALAFGDGRGGIDSHSLLAFMGGSDSTPEIRRGLIVLANSDSSSDELRERIRTALPSRDGTILEMTHLRKKEKKKRKTKRGPNCISKTIRAILGRKKPRS